MRRKKMTEKNIIEGDGSWQMRLDAGQCPKCGGSLTLNKQTGAIFCDICGLEIVDSTVLSDMISDSNEESEMETHLMPDEFSIAAREPRMQWQEAVTTIDRVIEDWLTDGGDVGGEVEEEVRAAWHRILQG
jgi:hypothetical protein